jgi:hypothetical protein
MNEEIKQREDFKFEVTDGGQWIAGPFDSHDDAQKWILAHRMRPKLVLPEDIRRAANHVEAAYLHRTAREDLAYLVGAAIAEERRRCLELTLSMNGGLIDAGGGLMRRPTFDYLADKIRKGSSV